MAEEFSEDARLKFEGSRGKSQDFLTGRIANARGIKHLLCDTDRRTKKSMGYRGEANWNMDTYRLQRQELPSIRPILAAALEVTKEFHLRENYWLERLKDVLPGRGRVRLRRLSR